MSKHRLEDIGFIRGKVEYLLEHEVWDSEKLSNAQFDIEFIQSILWEILDVAKGEDYLNQPEDGK